MITDPTDLDFLIPYLRLRLGDTDSSSYRYLDGWLKVALVQALKELERWWNFKYTVDESDYSVSRNSDWTYDFSAPPTIQHEDEKPIVLMASMIIKEGSLENNSWIAGSWRDAEFSVSNIEGSRAKENSWQKDWDELTSILKPPQKRLSTPTRSYMYGAEETNL